jgi:hypothetical protein
MASSTSNTLTKSLIAGEALVAYRRVKQSSSTWVYADADDIEDGVSTDDVASGDHLAAWLRNNGGSCILEMASSCSAGDLLYGADDGKVSTTKTGPALYRAMAAASGSASEIECMPIDQAGGGLIYSNTAASTSVEDTASETAFDTTKTIDGAILKAGDVLEVIGRVWVEDQNGADTLTVKLYVGTEEIVTSGAVTHADNDIFWIHAFIQIRVAGASGTLTAGGVVAGGVPGTVTAKPFRKAQASEDLSGDVTIQLKGTYSAAHADNESECEQFIVIHHRQ